MVEVFQIKSSWDSEQEGCASGAFVGESDCRPQAPLVTCSRHHSSVAARDAVLCAQHSLLCAAWGLRQMPKRCMLAGGGPGCRLEVGQVMSQGRSGRQVRNREQSSVTSIEIKAAD